MNTTLVMRHLPEQNTKQRRGEETEVELLSSAEPEPKLQAQADSTPGGIPVPKRRSAYLGV